MLYSPPQIYFHRLSLRYDSVVHLRKVRKGGMEIRTGVGRLNEWIDVHTFRKVYQSIVSSYSIKITLVELGDIRETLLYLYHIDFRY